jgi:hypothetical protein
MKNQMLQLNIPVPPAPLLEQAVGYQNYRNARFLALWWEPCGDEVMVSDGLVTFTGLWSRYLAYMQHSVVHPHLVAYNLGSSDCPADHHLLIDLAERQAFIGTGEEADKLLTTQWQKEAIGGCPPAEQENFISLSPQNLEKWIADMGQQLTHFPSMTELMSQMAEDEKCVASLEQWLDEQVQKPFN